MKKLTSLGVVAALLLAFVLSPAIFAQSTGGVFQPWADYTLSGQWTWQGSSPVCFEGATIDSSQTCLTPTDPTADRTLTLPNATDTIVGRATTDTLTNKTLTAPVLSGSITGTYTLAGTPTLTSPTISNPVFSGTATGTYTLDSPTITTPGISGLLATSSGLVLSKRCNLAENGSLTYTCSITIPAGAVIDSIDVIPQALWNGTSASLDVGDTDDPNGYFTAVDLKATDLVLGEMLSVRDESLWGGAEGAYLVAATGRRGPTTANFGQFYAAGSNILFVVTAGAADGSTGRTTCSVTYHIGSTVAQTVTP